MYRDGLKPVTDLFDQLEGGQDDPLYKHHQGMAGIRGYLACMNGAIDKGMGDGMNGGTDDGH